MNNYRVIRTLGNGGFGEAILVERISDGVKFVIKKILIGNSNPDGLAGARKEVEVLRTFDSPFIVKYIESFEDDGVLYIVMEYADGGDLSMMLNERRSHLQEDEVMHYFIQIVLALKYLHDKNILHRDIKGQNIFLCRDGTVKLGDFGIAKALDSTNQLAQTVIGTTFYMAPDVLKGSGYNSKADIWSLGCVLYELCALSRPFDANSLPELLMSIITGRYAPIPSQFSTNVRDLIDGMLQLNPEERLSVDQIIEMPFVRNKLGNLLRNLTNETFTSEARDGSRGNVYRVINKGVTIISEECLYRLMLVMKQHEKASLSSCFSGCSKLTVIEFPRKFDTGNVTDMNCMFFGCNNLSILNLSTFNTSNVTNMNGMFSGCSSLSSLDLSTFNTNSVTNMNGMFSGCSSLISLDLSTFNTNSVTDMNGMFSGCSSLISLDLSTFNTSSVTDMGCMFYGCSSLTSLDLSAFNTNNVTSMNEMFCECKKLTLLNLSKFDTSKVQYMGRMFDGCSGLTTLDLSTFNTCKVERMHSMFSGCSSLTSLDLSKFKTGNVISMYSMFLVCNGLVSLDLSTFNTDKVTDMGYMFYGCSGLTSLDISAFCTSGVKYMESVFSECNSLKNVKYEGKDKRIQEALKIS